MLYADGSDEGGQEVACCEELVDAGEAEEDGADVVFLELFFYPGGVLDGAIEYCDTI